MIRNKNIHKKFCIVMISLGLFFSVGQLAYAHNWELMDAESLVADNPTIENLKWLYTLYMNDISEHYSKEEYMEAHKSEQYAQQIMDKMEQIVIGALKQAQQIYYTASMNSTFDNWESTANCWNKIARMSEIIENEQCLGFAEIAIAQARTKQAKIIADCNNSPESYEAFAQRCDELVRLEKKHGQYLEDLTYYKILATEARTKRAKIIADRAKTSENYATLAHCWEKLAKLKKNDPKRIELVAYYKILGAKARVNQAKMITTEHPTSESYEFLAYYCNKLATLLKKHSKHSQKSAYYKMMAAKARVEQAQIITNNYATVDNYETLVHYCNKVVKLDKKCDQHIENVPYYKILAAEARVKQAIMIANNYVLYANYEILAQRCDEAIELINKHNIHNEQVQYYRMLATHARKTQEIMIENNVVDKYNDKYIENLIHYAMPMQRSIDFK